MTDLTEYQKIKIKRYYHLSRISGPAFIMAIMIPLLWTALVMIDDVFLGARRFYTAGLGVMIVLSISLLAVFCCGVLIPVIGMKTAEWQQIDAMLDHMYGADGPSLSPASMYAEDRRNRKLTPNLSRLVAERYLCPLSRRLYITAQGFGLSLGTGGKSRTGLVFLSLLILIGSYVPEFLNSVSFRKEQIRLISQEQQKITDVFESRGYRVLCDDPKDNMRHAYYISCHAEENSYGKYIYINLTPDGKLEKISYHLDLDETKKTEENTQIFNQSVLEMSSILQQAGLISKSGKDLTGYREVPSGLFRSLPEYLDSENQYNSMEENGVSLTLMYQAAGPSEYSKAYFYFTVRAE